jgi:hypothetical protein
MKGEILSCCVVMIAVFLVSQAIPENRWNFDEGANEMDFNEVQKRSDLERPKRICGVGSRRQGRCKMRVRFYMFSLYCIRAFNEVNLLHV